MLTFDDKGGRGVRKHPKHADVIYEWSLTVVYYKIVVHIFDMQKKTTSTVDRDNKSTEK